MKFSLAIITVILLNIPDLHAQDEADDQSFAVEYYYRIKWGHYSEWIELYKKNHYPILKRLQEKGDIVDMYAAYPVNHSSEDSRWDFRYTIVWKDVKTAHASDPDWDEKTKSELYPDRETFEKEEQRRFSLLLEHIDIPVWRDNLEDWD